MRPPGDAAGSTLVEVVVALAVLTPALLMGVALLLNQPRAQKRLEARQAAFGAIESTLEEIRATGVLPAAGGHPRAAPGSSGRAALLLRIDHSPVEDGPPGLVRVEVTVHYRVLGEVHRAGVETLVWTGP